MNETELQEELHAAKKFKEQRVAQTEREVELARRDLQRAEERRVVWINMIPADVLQAMSEDRERDARYAERGANVQRLKDIHAVALHEARRHGRGILPPESHSAKQTAFTLFGLGIGGLLGYFLNRYLFDTENELALLASGLVGCGLGFLVGSWLFSMNFVEDESLEGPLFESRA